MSETAHGKKPVIVPLHHLSSAQLSASAVADLGGVSGVQMHPPLVASLSINVVLHTLPAGSSNNQS